LIFVTVGTHEQQFNRLLKSIDSLRIDHERIVQFGFSTYPLQNCRALRFVQFDEMRSLMSRADAVVTHAGVGSIMLALSSGKRPVVAPRLHRFGEHVDDHQLEVAEAFARAGKVTLLKPDDDLAGKIVEAGHQVAESAIKPSQELVDFFNVAISAASQILPRS
jgi:UDP-N-acetylglucosamine transferase subunit ALG13